MTRDEVVSMLSLLRVSYPNFYSKMRKDDMFLVVDLWTEMFADDDATIVKFALKSLIETHTGFPPDIAAVKQKYRELIVSASGEPTDEELWHMVKKAARHDMTAARAEFEKLPKILQRFLGTPGTLREYAIMDSEIFNTVTRGQFLKQIAIIRDREEFDRRTPPEVKMIINRVANPLLEAHELTDDEENTRRNRVLDTLDSLPPSKM